MKGRIRTKQMNPQMNCVHDSLLVNLTAGHSESLNRLLKSTYPQRYNTFCISINQNICFSPRFTLMCYIINWNKDSKWLCRQCVNRAVSAVSGWLEAIQRITESPIWLLKEREWNKVLALLQPAVNEQHSSTITNALQSSLWLVECDTVLPEMSLTALLPFCILSA